MLEYTNRSIIKLQKQYNMLLSSLNYCTDDEKKDFIEELNKIEEKILDATDEVYIEEYDRLANKETYLLEEELSRLEKLVSLIEERQVYIKERKKSHMEITGKVVDCPEILGESLIPKYKKNIQIINKYKKNSVERKKLSNETEELKEKEKKCLNKLRLNARAIEELEKTLIDLFSKSFTSIDAFKLLDNNLEIENQFKELSYALEKAKENLDIANNSFNHIDALECRDMYNEINSEYNICFEKKMLLELILIYDKKVETFDELLAKREKINDILNNISNSNFYKLVYLEVSKQYNTLKIEEQDVKTYNTIKKQIENNNNLISKIDEENNSKEFKSVLDVLIQNEKIRQEKIIAEQRKREYEERQKQLILEAKKQEEIKRRQELIEEARREKEKKEQELILKQKMQEEQRKKEQEERMKQILEVQNNSVLKPRLTDYLNEEKEEPKELPISTIESKTKKIFVPNDIVFDNEDDIENTNNNVNNIFDSIYDEMKKEKDPSKVSIPVINNDNLVAKKVDEQLVNKNKINNDTNNKEDIFTNDMIFPEME